MNLHQLNESCYYFQGAVNIGYVKNEDNGLLIDAGIDKQTIKKVIKQLHLLQLPITHLFVTHAHADHYGGAEYLQSVEKIYTYAPQLESAILQNPILEPLYLFQGNKPLPEMRNKFLEGKPIKIDEVVKEGVYPFGTTAFQCIALPGHSINQFGLLIDGILFAADSYFGVEQLEKHKIPYIIDGQDTIESLEILKTITCAGAVPGHGMFEEHFQETVERNIAYHVSIKKSIEKLVYEFKEGISHEQLVSQICMKWNIRNVKVSSWLLFRTAVTAYVTMLVRENKVQLEIENYCLKIKPKQ